MIYARKNLIQANFIYENYIQKYYNVEILLRILLK